MARTHEFYELLEMIRNGSIKTRQGGKGQARRGRVVRKTAGRRSLPQGFDERLRDWQDIAQSYREGASQ
jgi:hypothetical protein